MKRVHEWKEPWKKGEPGSRLSKKALKDQKNFNEQRVKMDRDSEQVVKVICNRHWFLVGLFNSFTIKVKIPLTQTEFCDRMSAAFPNYTWENKK